ncbi:MAG: glycosyltransferase family 9 protein [Candidatus Omnitrophica bacterium]|nr:glycosyltransferase family 9 protein [Candidatus Omnitrophota bacterium]
MKIVTFAAKTLGDTIMATPLYRALRSLYPNQTIELVSEIDNHPVLEGIGLFDRELLFKDDIDFFSYDLAVMPVYCCRRQVQEAAQRAKKYIDLRAIYPKKPKNFGKRISSAYSHMLFEKHQVELNMELVKSLGYQGEIPPTYCPEPDQEIYPEHKDKIGLCIYTPADQFQEGKNRFWPLDKWVKLIGLFGKENVLIAGPEQDRPSMEKVAELSGAKLQITQKIKDFTGLCKQLRVVVTTDHGAMHIAACSGAAIVSLHGASSPVLLHPWVSSQGRSISVISPKFCSPCQRSYRLRFCERGITRMKCMKQISPESVFWAAKNMENIREGKSKILFGRRLLYPQEYKESLRVKFRHLLSIIISREIIRLIKLLTGKKRF